MRNTYIFLFFIYNGRVLLQKVVHKKYTYKDGKRYGPYLYENKRVDGKVVTTYLGATPANFPEERIGNLFYYFKLRNEGSYENSNNSRVGMNPSFIVNKAEGSL